MLESVMFLFRDLKPQEREDLEKLREVGRNWAGYGDDDSGDGTSDEMVEVEREEEEEEEEELLLGGPSPQASPATSPEVESDKE